MVALREPQPRYRIFVAWVFGREQVFEHCAKDIVRDMELDNHGSARPWADEYFKFPLPAGLIGMSCLRTYYLFTCLPNFRHPERVVTISLGLIKKMLATLYDTLKTYSSIDELDAEGKQVIVCKIPVRDDHTEGHEKCDIITKTFLTRGLKKVGFWPQRKAEDITESAQQLYKTLCSIQIPSADRPHNICADDYSRKRQIEATVSGCETPALAVHRQRMKAVFDGA